MIEEINASLTDNLPEKIYSIDGMSSRKVRNLLNTICKKGNYLEVGTWKGSTLISALFGNNIATAYAIENWSQFGDVKNEFFDNIKTYIPEQNLTVIEKDCFEVEIKDKIDIFFYDGPHDYHSQKKALKHFYHCLQERFIFVVDDFNEQDVSRGTMDSIKELGLKVSFMSHLPSRYNCDTENYWNGIGIFKLQK